MTDTQLSPAFMLSEGRFEQVICDSLPIPDIAGMTVLVC